MMKHRPHLNQVLIELQFESTKRAWHLSGNKRRNLFPKKKSAYSLNLITVVVLEFLELLWVDIGLGLGDLGGMLTYNWLAQTIIASDWLRRPHPKNAK